MREHFLSSAEGGFMLKRRRNSVGTSKNGVSVSPVYLRSRIGVFPRRVLIAQQRETLEEVGNRITKTREAEMVWL